MTTFIAFLICISATLIICAMAAILSLCKAASRDYSVTAEQDGKEPPLDAPPVHYPRHPSIVFRRHP